MGSFGSGHYFNQDRGTCEPLRRPKKSCDVSPSLLSPELPLRSLYHAVLYVPQSEVSRTQTPIGSVLWLPSPRGGVETIETMGVASHGPSAPGFFASATCSFPREAAGGRKMRREVAAPPRGNLWAPPAAFTRGGGRGGFCVRSRGTKRHQWTRGVGAVRRHRCGEELGSPVEERRGRRGGSGRGLGHGRRGHPEALVSPRSQASGAPGNRGACKHKRGWH